MKIALKSAGLFYKCTRGINQHGILKITKDVELVRLENKLINGNDGKRKKKIIELSKWIFIISFRL